jgi:hypothetical protein
MGTTKDEPDRADPSVSLNRLGAAFGTCCELKADQSMAQ